MHTFMQRGQMLFWESDGETLCVQPWGENSLRVRAVMMGELTDTDYALLPPTKTDVSIQIDEKKATITNGKIHVVAEEMGWGRKAALSFYNQRGELLLRETDGQGALNISARKFKPHVAGDHQLTVTFESNPEEMLFGMGQYQQEELNIKNCSFELAHRNSQASVPFVYSSLGYGFLWHNPAIGEAHFSRNATIWKAYSTRQMDYYITAGDSPAEISLAYAKATGFAPMMPEYGLGFWQCKLRYWNQEQLLEVAREHKRRGLPMDVIVCDFFHWPKMGDFRFEEEFFPDPKAMVDELKSMGIELMVSVWPQISLQSENFEEMRRHNLLIRSEKGEQVAMRFVEDSIFYDATNPRAREYVWEKCKKNYYDLGIRTFWLDEAEPEYGSYDFDNFRYHMGTNAQIGNIYPQQYAMNFYDGQKESGEENPVNLLRCAWAGSQRYGALVWSGDIHSTWEAFRSQVCAGLSMGMAGIPWWTTDIGGFTGGDPEDEGFRELLIRWFQWGAYCPVMRLHGNRLPMHPVKRQDGTDALGSGAENEVWSYGEEAYDILEKYLHIREGLRDYTRELMRETSKTGKPLMRPMFYEFPEDAACWQLKDQYMYGDKYLVAPVMRPGQRERSVYLPEGCAWKRDGNGKVYEGGQTVTVEAPLSEMPVFERI